MLGANILAELLKREWQSIREHLGGQWNEFLESYREIVASLPENPTRADVEEAADKICSLMSRYPCTHRLLQEWMSMPQERMLTSARETLSEQEQVRQICNRLKELAQERPTPGKAEQEKGQGIKKPSEGG